MLQEKYMLSQLNFPNPGYFILLPPTLGQILLGVRHGAFQKTVSMHLSFYLGYNIWRKIMIMNTAGAADGPNAGLNIGLLVCC